MVEYFYLITVLPLVGFLINGLFGTKIKSDCLSFQIAQEKDNSV